MRSTSPSPSPPPPGIPTRLLFSLALLSATGPFAIDLYLPSFPQMAEELGSTPAQVQSTLTAFLIGIAIGQLVFGSLSDRFGRRGPLLFGTLLCAIASALAALAPTVDLLMGARAFQGFAGAAGVVISRAIISDVVSGDTAARSLTLMASIGGIAPVVAPVAGGLLAPMIGWRGLLWALFAIAAIMFTLSLLVIPETRARAHMPKRRGPHRLSALRDPLYLLYGGVYVFSFAALMGYISAAPFVYQTVLGFTATAFGFFFGANAVLTVSAGFLASRLIRSHGARRILGFGVSTMAGGACLTLLASVSALTPVIYLPLALTAAGAGLTFGNAMALALDRVRRTAGTGSALLGTSQFTLGAIAAPLTGLSGSGSPLALGITMTCATAAAAALYLCARTRRGT